MINQTFKANEMKTGFPETGEYIFIESSPSKYITVRAETSMGVREYIMKERETNHVPKGETFTSLTVVNGEQIGDIVIRTGFGDFKQSNDHQKVTVDNEINLPSNITFATPQAIYPAAGSLFATQVQNFPSEYLVTFKGSQPVTVGNTLSIDDSTPLKVEMTNQIEAVINGEKDRSTSGLPDITFTATGTASIAEKAGRKEVIIQAPETNQSEIIIQGFFRLQPGGVTSIEEWKVVSLSGLEGDKVYCGEVM
ncbi:hypothetical protein [Vibrio sp. HN007]|uniref:hypothetical protein n=1 Tax=Vibrio iocasae TaxID=3098914 RepID=UPI0035D464B1